VKRTKRVLGDVLVQALTVVDVPTAARRYSAARRVSVTGCFAQPTTSNGASAPPYTARRVQTGRLGKALFGLGSFAGVVFILVGIAGGIWPGHWDDSPASDQIIWVALGVGGGLAILAGLRLLQRSPWSGATLVSLGGIVGALPIFWTILPLLVAIALVVLSVLYARRAGRRSDPEGA
jgi:hypothetical protein